MGKGESSACGALMEPGSRSACGQPLELALREGTKERHSVHHSSLGTHQTHLESSTALKVALRQNPELRSGPGPDQAKMLSHHLSNETSCQQEFIRYGTKLQKDDHAGPHLIINLLIFSKGIFPILARTALCLQANKLVQSLLPSPQGQSGEWRMAGKCGVQNGGQSGFTIEASI